MKDKFIEKSKEFVENYDIDSDNKKALETILKYFSGVDTKEAPLGKGLLIRGSIGSGKTITFKIIQQITKGFAINNIRDVVADFNLNGFDGISNYVKTSERVFDDIGSESHGKYYGNETDVVQELIIRRYELFQSKGLKTHFTTNLGTKDELLSKYGERAYDRLKEMCTLIILGNNTDSRRNKYKPVEKNKIAPKEKTPAEIYAYMKKSTIKAFEDFKEGDKSGCGFFIYNFLNEQKILDPTPERKRRSIIEAESEILSEIELGKDYVSPEKFKSQMKSFEKEKTKKLNRAKEIVLREYFAGLVEMDVEINEIF